MFELINIGAGTGPHHLAQGDGLISLVILIIIAVVSAIAEGRRKKAGKSPDEVARNEQQQYKQRAGDARRGQLPRGTGAVDEARSGYHGRTQVVPQRDKPMLQQTHQHPQQAVNQQRLARQQQQLAAQQRQAVVQRQQEVAAAARRPSYVTADELREAERKARDRVRLLSGRAQPAQPQPAAMAAAAGSITLDEIGSQRRQQAIDATTAQRTLTERTAHLTELQRGFIYHEIFSAIEHNALTTQT